MNPLVMQISTLALDVAVASLLAATIFYCLKLNKRIRILQDSKSELAKLIQKFDESTEQATHSINEIHTVSKKINEGIKARLEKANYIADDLAFMIEKGNKLANRMETEISPRTSSSTAGGSKRPVLEPEVEQAQTRARSAKVARGAAKKSSKKNAAMINEEIGDFEEEVAAKVTKRKASSKLQDEATPKEERTAALEAMLEKVSKGGKNAASTHGKRVLRPGARLRSKSEQDLYDALKSEQKA